MHPTFHNIMWISDDFLQDLQKRYHQETRYTYKLTPPSSRVHWNHQRYFHALYKWLESQR